MTSTDQFKSSQPPVIDQETVAHVATLARLNLSDEQKQALTPQLSDIVGLVNTLANAQETLEGDTLPHKLGMPMRQDVQRDQQQGEQYLSNAPQAEETFYRVPKIL